METDSSNLDRRNLDQATSDLTIEQRAKLFAALADPTRLRIVILLAAQQEASGSNLANQMGISLALFCHHSKILIAAELVRVRKQGQSKLLSLNHALLERSFVLFETGAKEEQNPQP